jgi:hypothetical protein
MPGIRQSFKEDKPYDRFVTEMLTVSAPNTNWMPDAAPSGFLTRWHVTGDTMYDDNYEDTADEIIVNSGRIFLGVNYQCISCHGGKGFLEKVSLDLVAKQRRDLWNMAAFFGRTRIRVVTYQDRYTVTDDGTGSDTKAPSQVRLQREGGQVHPTFLLTGEKADLGKPLRPQFARMLTTHPQFARATVNLIWNSSSACRRSWTRSIPSSSRGKARRPRCPCPGATSRPTANYSTRWPRILRHTASA